MYIWPFLLIGTFPIIFICYQKLMILLIYFDNLLYLSVQNPVPVQQPTAARPWGAPRQMPDGGHWISNRNYDCSICICCICICAFQSYPKSRAPVSNKMLLLLAYPKVSKKHPKRNVSPPEITNKTKNLQTISKRTQKYRGISKTIGILMRIQKYPKVSKHIYEHVANTSILGTACWCFPASFGYSQLGTKQAPEIPRTLWINGIQVHTTLLQGVICNS